MKQFNYNKIVLVPLLVLCGLYVFISSYAQVIRAKDARYNKETYNRNTYNAYQPGDVDVDVSTTSRGNGSTPENNKVVVQEESLSTPGVSCPVNKTVSTDPGNCSAIVNNIDPVITPSGAAVSYRIENGGLLTIGGGSASGVSFAKGINTVTYSLIDYPGTSCSFTVTVEDRESPVMICSPDLTVACPDEVPVPAPFTVIDNCSQSTTLYAEFVSDVRSNETCWNKYTITRTYKATDGSGNTSTCSQIITVNDDKPPHFVQPPPVSPLSVACPASVPVVFPDSYTAYDECNNEEVSVIFKQVKTNGPCANKYTLTRTWTATDVCGNTAEYSQVINVKDTVPPTFNMVPNQMNLVSCVSDITEAPYLSAEDNCYDLSALPTVTLNEVISDQQCANKFKLTRTWTATDACGNTATVSQIFVVLDAVPPVFDGTDPSSVNVSCEKDIPAAPTQTATDNCTANVTVNYSETKTNVQCANRFTLLRKWVASDGCGNTASRTQIINVADNEPPKVTSLSADPVVLWPPNHKMRDVMINYTATDNCGVTGTLEVSSSDPVSGGSDGDQAPDWEVIDAHHVRLRAEKANNGQARYYTIKVSITDGCNQPVDTSITVVVAHNITSPKTGTPYKVGSNVPFSGVFWDKPGNQHTAKWLVDGNAVTNGNVTEPAGNQNGKVSGNYKFNSPGVYKLQMNVTDQNGITSYANTNDDLDAIVVIYDPNGGYTYGGGYYDSPAGALRSNPNAMGKASYGFAVNYFKNSTNPKGETQFEFKVGDFEFNALNFDYLVINNAMAQFKGTGKIVGGQSGIGFTMTVLDGQLEGSGVDKIRMKIYNKNTGTIIYDNHPGANDASLPTQAVGSNSSIVISGTNSNLTSSNTTEKMELETKSPDDRNELEVISYPNPSITSFSIIVKTNVNERIVMQVFDINGKLIETRNVNVHSITSLGDTYRPGAYVVRVTQGLRHKELKLVKLPD
ncbi:MAG TPA: T9SS type A sorting domain-containing protein [Chitinophagaceae bacterium]|nr:T9SS type A sorting domain-containing protein [Chitinophagaceae bacterium]